MIEVIFSGRGGQGVVTAAEVAARAAWRAGWQAQAFPFFGPERLGGQVLSFLRLDKKPITLRQNITAADWLLAFNEQPANNNDWPLQPRCRLIINRTNQTTKNKNVLYAPVPPEFQTVGNMFLLGVLGRASGLFALNDLRAAGRDYFAKSEVARHALNNRAAAAGYNFSKPKP